MFQIDVPPGLPFALIPEMKPWGKLNVIPAPEPPMMESRRASDSGMASERDPDVVGMAKQLATMNEITLLLARILDPPVMRLG
jgi:hypothetical protein